MSSGKHEIRVVSTPMKSKEEKPAERKIESAINYQTARDVMWLLILPIKHSPVQIQECYVHHQQSWKLLYEDFLPSLKGNFKNKPTQK